MSVPLKRHYFTAAEYYRMADAGILTADDRVELIEGEIIEMSPIGKRHASCVDRIVNVVLRRHAGRDTIVRVQNPVRLSDFSEPQPDVALLRAREDFYAAGHPRPDDVLVVVEVADTSAAYDRDVKVPLYARSGIPEVWLVDLNEDRIEIYVSPSGGEYEEVKSASRGETVSSAAVVGLTFAVEEILG
jgi:Uma2 family endonuclease